MVAMNMDIQNRVKKPRNSFFPDCSLPVSKWDTRGVKEMRARSFFECGVRNGFETKSVPSGVFIAPPPFALELSPPSGIVTCKTPFGGGGADCLNTKLQFILRE